MRAALQGIDVFLQTPGKANGSNYPVLLGCGIHALKFIFSRSRTKSDPFFLFLYILPGARFRALSAGAHCSLRVAG